MLETLDRASLWAVQTPQVFRRAALERALAAPPEPLAARDRRRVAGRARRRDACASWRPARRTSRSRRRATCASPSCCWPSAARRTASPAILLESQPSRDADRLPRPPAPRRPRRERGRVLHARPTPSATARRPPSAGSPSSASPSTSTASAQALEIWRHPFWERYAHDDLDAYCEFVREQTDLRLGIEVDFVPGREDRIADLLDARELRLRRRLGPLPRATAPSTWTSTACGTRAGREPRAGLGALLRDARGERRAAACSTSSPTPTS